MPEDEPTRSEGEAHDTLTRIAQEAITAIEHHDGIRAIVLVNTDERGGIGITGYDKDSDAIAEMFLSLRAIMRANGQDMKLLGMNTPIGRDG